ncbi:MAG TPA: hypothetical protein VGM03_15950, partial [Phycisphaerae bacterium]
MRVQSSGFRVQAAASPLVGGAAHDAPGTRPDATDSRLRTPGSPELRLLLRIKGRTLLNRFHQAAA